MTAITARIDGELHTFPKGTELEKLAETVQDRYSGRIALAVVNGKLRELHKTLEKDAEVTFLTLSSTAGYRAYERSMQLLMNKSIYDLIPLEKIDSVVSQFSVSNGIYVEIRGEVTVDEELLERISARMAELAEADLPIRKFTSHVDDAVDFFRKFKMKEKEKVFYYRRSSFVNLYELDGFVDYYYGYMLPSTGYLRCFRLQLYKKGFVLLVPPRKTPGQIPPFIPQEKLYSLMLSSSDWSEKMHLATVGDINNQIAEGDLTDLVLISEAKQEAEIASIAYQITQRPGVKFVMIAGPSSSGKTSFSHRLSIQLKAQGRRPHPVAVDDYFVNREDNPKDENGNYDFEALECVDIAKFNEDMNALLAGETVPMPTFDFVEGKRTYKGNTLKIGEQDILVIEGIHCLNDRLSEQMPRESQFRIYISALTQLNIDEHNRIPTTDGRLIRRMIRDARTRGANAQDTIARWDSVRRGEEKNIFPYQESADVMFNSSLPYEFSVMKPYAEQLLYSVPKDSPEFLEAKRLLKFFDYFLPINADAIPRNSLIKEFIGGSIFKV